MFSSTQNPLVGPTEPVPEPQTRDSPTTSLFSKVSSPDVQQADQKYATVPPLEVRPYIDSRREEWRTWRAASFRFWHGMAWYDSRRQSRPLDPGSGAYLRNMQLTNTDLSAGSKVSVAGPHERRGGRTGGGGRLAPILAWYDDGPTAAVSLHPVPDSRSPADPVQSLDPALGFGGVPARRTSRRQRGRWPDWGGTCEQGDGARLR
ncbi:unnamed protein product [Calypogeia fissa]